MKLFASIAARIFLISLVFWIGIEYGLINEKVSETNEFVLPIITFIMFISYDFYLVMMYYADRRI